MIKIAIYSGEIPSTTFIENLIVTISKSNYCIYLFGKKHSETNYKSSNINLYPTPGKKFNLLFFVIRNATKLLITSPKKLFQLYHNIGKLKQDNKSYLHEFGVALPVLLHPVDIFHVQWAKSIVSLEYLLEIIDSKIILSLRGAHIDYSPIANSNLAEDYRRLFPKLDHFHAVSQAIAKEGQKYNCDPSKTTVINPAVKENLLQYNNFPYRKDEDVLRIISVGRLHWKKGYDYALNAMSMLKSKGIKLKYTIIAKGDNEEYIFHLHDLNLKNEVEIIDYLPHEKVLQTLTGHHLFLLSSVEEGIANVVLEAMAVGLPVISTNCGGMEEVIEHEKNGWIVPIRDPESISNAIIKFTKTDQKDISDIITCAKKTIKDKFLLKQQTEKFNKLYQRVLHE